MGQFEITGDAAESFVSHMISARVSDLVAPMARYSLLLNEKGGIIDDLFVYRLQNSWWIVVNASNRAVDLEWFRSHVPSNVSVVDRSDDTYMIAVQGPRAIELLDKIQYSGFADPALLLGKYLHKRYSYPLRSYRLYW